MAVQTLGKALSIFGISPSVVEVFFVDHEEQVNKAKFADHLAQEGISFDTDEEYQMRMSIFVEKDKEIDEINASQDDYEVAHNHLSTYTEDEMKMVMGHVPESDDLKAPVILEASDNAGVNWVTAGMVNAIQNQGRCGSCWAFSSIAAIESAHAIAGNPRIKLSEQQLVNCVTDAGGCNGGGYVAAFSYAETNKLVLEIKYPYRGKKGDCQTAALEKMGLLQISDFKKVTSRSVSQFKAALSKQPVGIAIAASSRSFQQYKRGILTKNCGESLNHDVTAVGYGTTKQGVDYVLIRNSWSTRWGNKGYGQIALNDQNICGILINVQYPIV